MERTGDELAGYSIEFDAVANAVRVRGWGFWNAEVAASFGGKVTEACANRPRVASIQLEVTGLKPMREEGQRSFVSLLTALPKTVTLTVVATGNHLTKLQLMRLAAGVPSSKDRIKFV